MPRRPPDPLEYYLDANLDGPALVERLRAGGMPCQAHRDHYPGDADDEAWIPPVAAKGWVIVTRDFAIKRRPAEREAWISAGAVVLMVRGEKLSAEDMAGALLKAHAQGRLDNFILKRIPPMIVYLHKDGRCEVHYGATRRGGHRKG